jgi:transposase
MSHITGSERSQLLLLPEAIDDYVGADNPVLFIDAFVNGLDLGAVGFIRVAPAKTGRPGYMPGGMLYIYGYLNRVRSSRLEAECHRNVEVIWLLRTLKPDFKTIADFRADNRKTFRAVFRRFVVLYRELNLFGRELIAVDGTRIKAVNNKDRNFTKNSLEKFIKAVGRTSRRISAKCRAWARYVSTSALTVLKETVSTAANFTGDLVSAVKQFGSRTLPSLIYKLAHMQNLRLCIRLNQREIQPSASRRRTRELNFKLTHHQGAETVGGVNATALRTIDQGTPRRRLEVPIWAPKSPPYAVAP